MGSKWRIEGEALFERAGVGSTLFTQDFLWILGNRGRLQTRPNVGADGLGVRSLRDSGRGGREEGGNPSGHAAARPCND